MSNATKIITPSQQLVIEVQEFLRNVQYRDGEAIGLTQDVEAIEKAYNEARVASNEYAALLEERDALRSALEAMYAGVPDAVRSHAHKFDENSTIRIEVLVGAITKAAAALQGKGTE